MMSSAAAGAARQGVPVTTTTTTTITTPPFPQCEWPLPVLEAVGEEAHKLFTDIDIDKSGPFENR